jgi:hypothetical protein
MHGLSRVAKFFGQVRWPKFFGPSSLDQVLWTKFFLTKFFHRVFRACRKQRYCAVNRRAQRFSIFLMPEGDSRVAGYGVLRFGGVRGWLT